MKIFSKTNARKTRKVVTENSVSSEEMEREQGSPKSDEKV
jgi:hypothetical protein